MQSVTLVKVVFIAVWFNFSSLGCYCSANKK